MVTRRSLRFVFAGVLIFIAGTLVGRAQPSSPDFEIRVTAPVGTATATCLRGCQFQQIDQTGLERWSESLADTINSTCPGAPGTLCTWVFRGVIGRSQNATR